MAKHKIKYIVIFCILIVFSFLGSVSLSLAFYQAKRQATGNVTMDKGIFMEFGNVEGEGLNCKLLTLDNQELNTSFIPNQIVDIKNPYIKLLNNSVDVFVRAKLSYKFYTNDVEAVLTKSELETLNEIFVLDSLNQSITFSDKFLPDENNEWFYYSKDISQTNASQNNLKILNIDFGELSIFNNPKLVANNFGGEGGSPNEVTKIEIYLVVEVLQANDSSSEVFGFASTSEVAVLKNLTLNDANNISYYETTSTVEIISITGEEAIISPEDCLNFQNKQILIEPAAFEGEMLTILDAKFFLSIFNEIINWFENGKSILINNSLYNHLIDNKLADSQLLDEYIVAGYLTILDVE